jgi:hypothetical protein
MRHFPRNALAWCAGVVAATMALELSLRVLPVPMGLYRTENYQRWPLENYQPHLRYTTSMSWELRNVRYGSTNNYGQIAPFDFVPRSRPIIVVGDSFVNSEMNWYRDTLQGQLGDLLRRREAVYGLGANGLSISDYLALAKMAGDEFSPAGAAFLIIDGDVSESLLRQLGHYNFAVLDDRVELQYWPLRGTSTGKSLRRVVGDSALYRYVELNLRFDAEHLLAQSLGPAVPASRDGALRRPMLPSERRAIDYFLDNLGRELKLAPSSVVLLFHSDTYAIADPAAAVSVKDSAEVVRYFTGRARELGYRVVELEERFRMDYARNGQRLDFWPLDRHLNGRGHRIAAEAAAEALGLSPFDTMSH